MITGVDHVVLAQGPAAAVVDRFLTSWLSRWPELRCASGEDDSDGAFSPWVPGGTGTSDGRGALLIARDEEMEASWDTTGYTVDEHGDGPLALFHEAAGWRSLSMTPQRDPYDRAGFPYEPYDITVAGAGLHLFTLVTPDDSTFIRAALDTLLLAAGTSLPGR
ncbi:hypothetical protein ACFYR2_33875 [Streptomyces microflavus]|uniref:hypothetical protein n=1 Tax=Streptomyces microflavus TaxID=1919 RepID=UPI0036C2EF31